MLAAQDFQPRADHFVKFTADHRSGGLPFHNFGRQIWTRETSDPNYRAILQNHFAHGAHVPAFEGKVRLQSEWLRRGENLIRLRAESGVPIVVARLTSWHPLTYAERQSGVIRMRLYALQPSQDVLTPSETLRPIPLGGVVRTGTLLRVEVELTRPRNVSDWDYSVLEAPFPAGCAPVDTEAFLKAGWWASDYSEIRDDRALSFQSSWGWYHDTHRFAFLVRAEVPGEYSILPARLWGMYAPFSVSSEAFRIVVRE
jgi:hypothetical protein